ncbi:MAG: hypothetical protein RLN78_02810 [Phycisphaerales bacterium]|jgi:hypothetical protein|tara:strand:+ start:76 stop:285 length:210 start_codon:yes stop_codon:yes gene_type:complete
MTPSTTTLANADWDAFVQSASSAVSDLADAKYMLIAVGVLCVLYINLRLARWISTSIHFDPPKHPPHDS